MITIEVRFTYVDRASARMHATICKLSRVPCIGERIRFDELPSEGINSSAAFRVIEVEHHEVPNSTDYIVAKVWVVPA